MTKKYWVILLAAIFVAFVIRFWNLSTLPYPPNGDELAFGYYGWSILHFGTDEYKNAFPLYFPSVGDYKYPTLVYLNTIPAALFGLSEVTVRFWSAVAGVALVPLLFMLSWLLFGSIIAALAAAWLVALAPWSVTLSRMGYEANVAVTLTVAGMVCLLLANKKKTKKYVVSAFILFLMSAFCYGAQRVFIPLILISLTALTFIPKTNWQALRKPTLVILAIIVLLSAIGLSSWESRGRARGVLWKELSSEELVTLAASIHDAGISPLDPPIFLTRVFHNKYAYTGLSFVQRYISHFTPDYLFIKGDASPERIPGLGVLLMIEMLFIPLGLIAIARRPDNRGWLIVAWMIVGPVASALTVNPPHEIRGAIALPSFAVISGLGVATLLGILKSRFYQRLALVAVAGVILLNGSFLAYQMFIDKPVYRPWFTTQATKEMVQEVMARKDQFKAVGLTRDDYIFFLFYGGISPEEFIANSKISPVSETNQWERVESLYNIHFKMPSACPSGGRLHVLYVCEGQNIPQNSKVYKTIRYWDGVPAYTFIEFHPISEMPAHLPDLPQGLHYMVDRESILPDGIMPEESDKLW